MEPLKTKIQAIYNRLAMINTSEIKTKDFFKLLKARKLIYSEKKSFGVNTPSDKFFIEEERKNFFRNKKELKRQRKERFDRTTTFYTLFYSTALSADYGTFHCSKCGDTFYHSPSVVKRGMKIIQVNACGHCTNDIMNKIIFR